MCKLKGIKKTVYQLQENIEAELGYVKTREKKKSMKNIKS